MCILFIAHRVVRGTRLVVAANRDELHARPTLAAARWLDDARIAGGRDVELGGTWLGVRDDGRFAAVTNVREVPLSRGARSRGELTASFLTSDEAPLAYATRVRADDADVGPYNLLVSDGSTLVYASNRDGKPKALPEGFYGISNDRLDTPWPKLRNGRTRFEFCLTAGVDEDGLFALLADRTMPADDELPDTGVGLAVERLLAPIFVSSPTYGTRSSTVLVVSDSGSIRLVERRFDSAGSQTGTSTVELP